MSKKARAIQVDFLLKENKNYATANHFRFLTIRKFNPLFLHDSYNKKQGKVNDNKNLFLPIVTFHIS